MLIIDKLSRVPVYEQVVSQLEKLIAMGEYASEQPLPSVRALATQLGINPNTLQKAYAELERRGFCVSSPGSGRFVSRHAQELMEVRARKKIGDFSALAAELLQAGVEGEELLACVRRAMDVAEKKGEETHD